LLEAAAAAAESMMLSFWDGDNGATDFDKHLVLLRSGLLMLVACLFVVLL
jgi:hypothetical protein